MMMQGNNASNWYWRVAVHYTTSWTQPTRPWQTWGAHDGN